jgi:hypothetical protein
MTGRAVKHQAIIRAAVERSVATPFNYGIDDCLMWLANIYVEALGVDPAAPYRGRYRTPRGALRVLGKGGVAEALAETAGRMAWAPILPPAAQVLDLGMIETAEGPAGAICAGEYWMSRFEYGFAASRLTFIDAAWRVRLPSGLSVGEGETCQP